MPASRSCDPTTITTPSITSTPTGCLTKTRRSAIIDETESPDSVTNWQFVGELQLRTYDPATGWSEPTPLYDPDIFGPIANYNLIMRNDTVLVGAYVHPSAMETISSESGTLVHAEDFTRMGAKCDNPNEVVANCDCKHTRG